MSLAATAPTGYLPQAGRDGYRGQLSNTTCFFRNLVQLETIADQAGRMWPSPTTLTVLHVGGSIGCEALSFLIALRERKPHLQARAISSDFHPGNAVAGRAGLYPALLFEPVFPGEGGDRHGWRDRWFEPVQSAEGGRFRPVEGLRRQLSFLDADASQPGALPAADIVFCQNVLIHMEPALARRALENVLVALRPKALLACGGMDLDLKPCLAEAGLRPLPDHLEAIHEGWGACRQHHRDSPGTYYFELEDIDRSRPDWLGRYSQIFFRD